MSSESYQFALLALISATQLKLPQPFWVGVFTWCLLHVGQALWSTQT